MGTNFCAAILRSNVSFYYIRSFEIFIPNKAETHFKYLLRKKTKYSFIKSYFETSFARCLVMLCKYLAQFSLLIFLKLQFKILVSCTEPNFFSFFSGKPQTSFSILFTTDVPIPT